jgi:hypothetical protein
MANGQESKPHSDADKRHSTTESKDATNAAGQTDSSRWHSRHRLPQNGDALGGPAQRVERGIFVSSLLAL